MDSPIYESIENIRRLIGEIGNELLNILQEDDVDLKSCQTFEELARKVDEYINYYNNERPQWCLNGKTPAENRVFTS